MTGAKKILSPYARKVLALDSESREAFEAFKAADLDHNGSLDRNEFMAWFQKEQKKKDDCSKKLAPASQVTRAAVSSALEKKIAQRPPHAKLVAKNLLHDDHDLSHAPKIVAATKALKLSFKKDVLHQKVRERVPIGELHARGIMKPEFHRNKIDGRLVQPMISLQKSFKKDVLSQALRARPTHEDLYKKGIMSADHHIEQMDGKLVAPSIALAKSFKKDLLSQQLARRSSIGQMKAKNILHASHGDVCHSLHQQSIALDKSFKNDKLSSSLRKRPSLTELHAQGIVDKSHPTYAQHPEVEDGHLSRTKTLGRKFNQLPAVLPFETAAVEDASLDLMTSAVADGAADEDADLKSCLVEVQRALKNLRELRGWLEKIPN